MFFFADWHADVDAKPYDDENTEEVEVYTNPFVSLKNDVIDIINCIIKFNLTNNALIVIDY